MTDKHLTKIGYGKYRNSDGGILYTSQDLGGAYNHCFPDIEMRTIDQVISNLPSPQIKVLPTPSLYKGPEKETRTRLFLASASMKEHTADAGWQLTLALERAGYKLVGEDLTLNSTHVPTILESENPGVVLVQDKREWEGLTANRYGSSEKFYGIEELKKRPDIFKMTILKDAHQRPAYHRESAEEIGCHGWIIYYHPRIVKHVAPFIRPEHCIRTYHSIDFEAVPPYSTQRSGCVLSGAVSRHYPLRQKLLRSLGSLYATDFIKHPGYHCRGVVTPEYLKKLSRYKVSLCTSSRYGYSLRKIIESTAVGCRVITDLPVDDVLPEIDENLVRVSPDITPQKMSRLIKHLIEAYDPEFQSRMIERCLSFYDWRRASERLKEQIENLRMSYVRRHPTTTI